MSWVNVADAAAFYSVSERAIRAACQRGSKKYMHRKSTGVGGASGMVYEIWIDDGNQEDTNDTIVTNEKIKLSPELDLTLPKTPNKGQNRAMLKAKVCLMAEKRPQDQTLNDFISSLGVEFDHIKINMNNLKRWLRLYRQAINAGDDIVEALSDNRGRPEGMHSLTDDHKKLIISYLLRRDKKPLVSGIYRNLKQLYPDAPSLRTVERFVVSWKQENRLLWAHASNPDKAKGRFKPAIGSASEAFKYNNAAWELDATVADVMTSDGKRWTVYGLIDVYSRRVVVTLEKKTSSYAVSRNLRAGMLKLGIPELLITDNGRDYVSNHIDEMCIRMGIGKKEVPPYSGEYKPHIERFFGTLTRDLFREINGFVGHSVAERQELKSQRSFEQRLEAKKKWRAKQWSEDAFAKRLLRSQEADLFVELPVSTQDLDAMIGAWVDEYEHRYHRGLKCTPMEAWQRGGEVRTVKDERTLDLLMGDSSLRSVSKEGIVIRSDGLEMQYWDVKLVDYIGAKVKVVMPDDMSSVMVYDAISGEYICEALDPSVNSEAKRSLIKEANREYRKAASLANKATREAEKQGKVYDDQIASIHKTTPKAKEDVIDKQASQEEQRPKTGIKKYDGLIDRFYQRMLDGSWDDKDDKLAKENPDLYDIALTKVEAQSAG